VALFLQRVFLISGITLLIDIAFFGPGLVLPGTGVSIRRPLFVFMLVLLAFRRAMRQRAFTILEVAFVALLGTFGVFWGIVVPSSYGYLLPQSFADISPWLGLLTIALWPWDAWPEEAQWQGFCKFLVVVTVLLALAHLGISALLITGVVSVDVFSAAADLISSSADGQSFLKIVALEGGQYRVYWSSSIFLLGGIYFLAVTRPRPVTIRWLIALGLACFALATTYIRAFLGALAIFVLLGWVLRRLYSAARVEFPIATILGIWMFGIISVSIAINPTFLATVGLARDESDVDRVEQAGALLAQFQSHPLVGTGFGSYVFQVVRGADAPYSYELVFYALIMKLGVIGTIVLILILGLALRLVWARRLASTRKADFARWTAFTTGLWFCGATNPMVTNFVGMTIVVLIFVDMRVRANATQ
jgi:hypothetical protein